MKDTTVKLKKRRGPWYDVWRSLISNKLTVVCMIIAGLLLFLALFSDLLFDYETQVIVGNAVDRLQSPSKEHWFGTDAFGRDYFARILYATRITMVIAFCSVAGSTLISIFIGTVAAYYGGLLLSVVQRLLDIIISVPQTLFALCIVAVLGGGVVNLIIALIVAIIPGLTRCVCAEIMVAKENEYIEAAKSVGASDFHIMFSHLIPNCMGPIIVRATMNISGCILSTAALGYLSMGVAAPQPEWGAMLADAQEFMREKLYLIMVPGLAIILSAVVFNLLGDGLRDALDPRLRGYRKTKKNHGTRRKS